MKPISIYVHIPFCVQKCLYCDFPSYAGKEEIWELYIDTLTREIDAVGSHIEDREVTTIFFGGGTPTVLPSPLLEKLIKVLLKNFRISSNAEITLEANPGTLKYSTLKEAVFMGFNRISLGVQAWQNELLKKLGRIHTIETFLKNYQDILDAGFRNINLDLMFGLPDQTIGQWQETLLEAVKLKPNHLSCYSLIIEEGTPFYTMKQNALLSLQSEKTEREMYYLAQEITKDAGYQQYEISNFCLPEQESKHNVVYWEGKEYLGFGLGSHSYYQNQRYHNTYDLNEYLRFTGKLNEIQQDFEEITKTMEMEEFMFLGLRMTAGIEKSRFYQKFGVDIKDVYQEEMKKLLKNGLLAEHEDRIFLTRRGIDISNVVFTQFLLDH